jgi:hypothetical protein
MRNSRLARTYLTVFLGLGWFIVVVALFSFFLAVGPLGLYRALLGTFSVVLMGLFFVTVVQIALTQLATAENTREILRALDMAGAPGRAAPGEETAEEPAPAARIAGRARG